VLSVIYIAKIVKITKSLFLVVVFLYYLKSAGIFYYKAGEPTIIGNAQKNLLTVSGDMFALLFSALHQY